MPAEGVVWMLRQPPTYTRHLVSMTALRQHEGIMGSRAKGTVMPTPGVAIVPGFDPSL